MGRRSQRAHWEFPCGHIALVIDGPCINRVELHQEQARSLKLETRVPELHDYSSLDRPQC